MPVDAGSRPGSIPELLAQTAERRAQETCVDHRGRRRTCTRLLEDVDRLAQGLIDLGVRPGQRVALVCALHPEAVVAVHAIWRIGAIAVPHDPESTSRELRRVFEDHSPVLTIADRSALGAIRDLPRDVHPKAVVAVDPPRSARDMVRSAVQSAVREQLRSAVRLRPRPVSLRLRARQHPRPRVLDRTIPWSIVMASCPLDASHPRPGPHDLALLQYTTGPDGEVLGAMLTHENLLESTRRLTRLWAEDAEAPGPVVATVALHEVAGVLLAALAPLCEGRSVVLAPRPDDVLPAVRRTRPEVLCGPAPVLLGAALSSPACAADLSRVPRTLTLLDGSSPEVVRRLDRLTGREAVVVDARPECGISFAGVFDTAHGRPLCRPLDGVQTDVVDGELRVAGPQVFHGYWNRPDETAHVLSGDGWVRTGAQVAPRPDGELELLASSRSRINAPDGRTVSPREVAAALLGHPDVSDAVITGEDLPDGGQEVRARVALRAGSTCTAEELERFVASRVAPVKVPRRIDIAPGPVRGTEAPGAA